MDSEKAADGRALRLTGLLATAVGLTAIWTAYRLFADVSFAPAALAEALIRATPGGVATWLIDHLHLWAMRLLTISAIAATLLAGAEMLRLSSRRRLRPFVAGAALFALGIVAALVQPAPAPNYLASAVALFVAGVLYALTARAVYAGLGPEPVDAGRRRALKLGLSGTGALLLAGAGGGWLAQRLAAPNTNVPLVPAAQAAEIPTRPSWPQIPGMLPEVTPAADHYVVDIDLISPSVTSDSWSLKLHGAVDKQATYDFASLQSSFEVVEEYAVLTCVSNEVNGDLIGNSLWGGVRLGDVLDAAGVKKGSVDVVFVAADGYSDSIPLEVARHPSTLLAVAQDRAPLRQEHGFPCRVRVPAIYGMKNVKWVTAIEVVDSNFRGYWQNRGWSDVAEVRTQSRIVVAGEDGHASPGRDTWIAGVAWAGLRGIGKVEVSTDEGRSWQQAQLKEPISPYSWRLWAYRWRPTKSGSTIATARATDGTGALQTRMIAPPHPAGATGYPSVQVEVA